MALLIDSELTTSISGGGGDAANLTLDSPFLVLAGSQFIANAFSGRGGNIRLNVLLADPNSIVAASSALVINEIVFPLSGALGPLPQIFMSVAALLPVRCAARAQGGRYSSLVLGGRDGLPPDPSGVLPSPLALEERLVADSTVTGALHRQTSAARFAFLVDEEKALPRLRGTPQALGCTH